MPLGSFLRVRCHAVRGLSLDNSEVRLGGLLYNRMGFKVGDRKIRFLVQ